MRVSNLMVLVATAMNPAPPPPIYDGNPGPFTVFVDETGHVVEEWRDTLKEVARSWDHSGDPRHGAFLLCFRSKTPKPSVEKVAVKEATDLLMVAGANVTTVGTPRICKALSPLNPATRQSDRDAVEIWGLLMPYSR